MIIDAWLEREEIVLVVLVSRALGIGLGDWEKDGAQDPDYADDGCYTFLKKDDVFRLNLS